MAKKKRTESIIKDIRRQTRKKYSSEEKIRIVLEGLKGEESISEICSREGIAPALYYRWSKDFLEAGKKRLLIGDEYFFVDLVFYYRILHCHVIVELKVDEFKHEYAGQLNAYVNYYKDKVLEKGDNPPFGILLCTGQNEALVKYASGSMQNKLFVNEYRLKIPSEN